MAELLQLSDIAARVRAAERALAASTFIFEIVSSKRGTVLVTAPLIFEGEIEKYTWHVHRDPKRAPGRQLSARTNVRDADGRWRTVSLHQLVWRLAGNPPARQLDHVNGDALDNGLGNLRAASGSENQRNRRPNTGRSVKGVHWRKDRGKWQAAIAVDGRQISLGLYADKTSAQVARDIATIQIHGKFGRVNDPPSKFAGIVSRDRYERILRQRVAEAEQGDVQLAS